MTTRAPVSPSFVGAAILLLILLLAGTLLAWRDMGRPDAPALAAAASTSTPDATATVHGVPWGHPLDVGGAAAAASVAVAVLAHPDVTLDTTRFDAVAGVVLAPAEASRQAEIVATSRRLLDDQGWSDAPESRRSYHHAVLAIRPLRISDGSATVEVWGMTLLGVGDNGGATFATTTVQLTVDDGAWRVTHMDSVAGPVPVVADVPSPPGALRLLLRDAISVAPLPIPGTVP